MKIVIFNVSDSIAKSLAKFGILNDVSSDLVNLDQFLAKATNLASVEVRVAFASKYKSVRVSPRFQEKTVAIAAADSVRNFTLVASQDDAADVEKDLGKAGGN